MSVESVTPTIAQKLLAHYDVHARKLPWRMPPGSNGADPYRIWLSEVMLQQTTVAAVGPYFAKFIESWPDVESLAAAEDADLMAAWAGLGYYARARNLLACARAVVADHGGVFPNTEERLLSLPGVGAYTAAAVAAIAFGQRAVVVDANVERVVARLFAITTPMPSARVEIRRHTDQITPEVRSGDFAQAMMDLGATICTSRNPACGICPLRENCAAVATAEPTAFPVKAPKKPKPQRRGHAWWIERGDGHVWLVRRPDKGLLGGMRALPSSDWSDTPDVTPPLFTQWRTLSTSVTRVFTHFSLEMTIHHALVEEGAMEDKVGEWWPVDRIEDAGLPTLFRHVTTAVLKERK